MKTLTQFVSEIKIPTPFIFHVDMHTKYPSLRVRHTHAQTYNVSDADAAGQQTKILSQDYANTIRQSYPDSIT